MKLKVFLVDDDAELNNILKLYLQNEGFEVVPFFSGLEAIKAIPLRPHIWILDIMLKDTDGFDIIKKIKEHSPDVPVIFISARDQSFDRVLGLEMGCDDYIAKPFLPRELVIRVKRLIDRTYSINMDAKEKTVLIGEYEINISKRRIFKDGALIDLTSKETELIIALIENSGKPLTRDNLLNIVWGENYYGSDRVVDDLIRRIRSKMPTLNIETVYGLGYRLV